jgi:hypothetical protein
MIFRSRHIGVAVAATLAGLGTTSTAHAQWVMGGTQWANNYFTTVVTSFTVPPAPTAQSSAVTNIWPGIEDAQGTWVLQPVLSYGFLEEGWLMDNQVYGPSNGNPNNTACPTGNATYCDEPQQVNAGDSIIAGVALDWTNLGSGCNTNTGTNCNYNLIWIDTTTHQTSELKDWVAPTPLRWAQGLVFEANFYTGTGLPGPSTCADYPAAREFEATVGLYESSGSNLQVQDVTNLSAGYPGFGNGFNWESPPVSGCFFQAFASPGTASSPAGEISFWFWN